MKKAIFNCIFPGLLASCTFQPKTNCDFPYLERGADVYADVDQYKLMRDTSLAVLFDKSYFSQLPEFLAAKKDGRVKFETLRVSVQGDGGFSGMLIKKGPSYPNDINIIFPDLEGSRKLHLLRVENGWKVDSFENSPEQVMFE